ncbi:MAG: hypothetical protein P4M00_18255 [Azospirillaceae bacterium]|nr:hypothetical protein [Azospirillaceae bacterium]
MMAKRNDHWALAGLLIGQYGTEATQAARRLADEANDQEVSAIWHDVLRALTPAPSKCVAGPA